MIPPAWKGGTFRQLKEKNDLQPQFKYELFHIYLTSLVNYREKFPNLVQSIIRVLHIIVSSAYK